MAGILDVGVGMASAGDGAKNIINDLSRSAMSSMEQFITPVRIEKGHPEEALTPGFRGPKSNMDEFGNFGGGAVGPTIDELDPYFPQNVSSDGDDGTNFMERNDYRIINHNQVTCDNGDFNIRKAEDETPGTRAAISVVQPMSALRGPLIISGWGFGMDDLPVPAQAGERRQFDGNLVHDRSLWKTGAVHLMWDEDGQVWRGSYQIVCGVVSGEITAPDDVATPTQFTLELLRNTGGSDGATTLDTDLEEKIIVQNRDPSLEQEAESGKIFCIAIKLNYEWIPLWVGCPSDE